jgi:DNA-binding MarR family transcriptional regulator
MNTRTLSPRGRLLIGLWLTSEYLSARIDHSLGAVHGISYVEFMVLYQLALSPAPGMRRVDLASAVGRTPSALTRLLRPMEKIGLVARDHSARDARVSLVTLTEAGRERLQDALSTLNDMGGRLTKGVGDAQVDTVSECLGVLRD